MAVYEQEAGEAMSDETKVAAGVVLTLVFGALAAILMACTGVTEASGVAQQCSAACAPARGTIVSVGYGQCVCAPLLSDVTK